jgi:hypothetical protein
MSSPAFGAADERQQTVIAMARAAMAMPGIPELAQDALRMFRHYCEQPMPRIPGCDTKLRLAIRIHLGMSVECAVGREYRYRWHLFLGTWINHIEAKSSSQFIRKSMCYPAPRLLGQ